MAISPHTLARRDDPHTSKEAAQELVESGELGRQHLKVLALVYSSPGNTSAELAGEDLGLRYQIARRLPELERLGWIERGSARQCNQTGHKALTWWVKKEEELDW